nr:uncharacterized protein LOC105487353 [Macaca nemestrina]
MKQFLELIEKKGIECANRLDIECEREEWRLVLRPQKHKPMWSTASLSKAGVEDEKRDHKMGREPVCGWCPEHAALRRDLYMGWPGRAWLPRGTSTALPLRTIFADKILITSTFRQLHRAPQTHIPDDTAQKLAAGDDITLDNITLAQDIAIRDASPGH